MKNILLFAVCTIITGASISQQAVATEIQTIEEGVQKPKTFIPLYPETKEIMEDMIDLNEVYKKVEASSNIAPDSAVLKTIKEHSVQYIQDLKEGYAKVEKTNNSIDRQEIVEAIHQKNNPFVSFYY